MIKSVKLFSVFVCTALVCTVVSAREPDLGRNSKSENNANNGARAANCAPGVRVTDMAFNNVRTLIETPGTMWQDRARGRGAYFVPRPPDGEIGPSSIFAGALWMGGVDPAGNLKLAGVTFRQRGNDYWPGPLTDDGSATIIASECAKYDNHFYMSRAMVELHRLYFNRLADDAENGTNTVNDPPFEEEPYSIPEEIINWPAHGDLSLGQDFYLAPFLDNPRGGGTEGVYEPELGDYPWYDLEQSEEDCLNRDREAPIPLFGDQTLWWVFNDKGNIHTESQGQPIGMEIKAQAFAFNTQDEINVMTFYNYTLINRGTQTLNNTFFGQWVDADLGGSNDDYVGCDVQRGLGYCYNGDNNDLDDGGAIGYGVQPPAVGIDFFEGPYQDADGMDNPGPNSDSLQASIPCLIAAAGEGIPYAGLGIGYGDGIVDNERYGMRRFVFHNRTGGNINTQDPQVAEHFYNYMRGIWRDGTVMTHGGTGYNPNNPSALPAQYMFPGDTDPENWGTYCIDPGNDNWTEEGEGNPAGDRRFIQSAGPFTLTPGDYNNITVGAVWARATSGGPFASVQLLRRVDDKAQALFDNCFRILDGPDAPQLTWQELDKEIILYISNNIPTSNNYKEEYEELDATIPPFTVILDEEGQEIGAVANDRFYRFQGYKIYQLRDENSDVSDINDPAIARLAFQCDVKDGITKLINYTFDPDLELPVPELMVDGADDGVQHSFRVTRDLFAIDDDRLINFKQYYFVAIAYGSNQYEEFDVASGLGQQNEYLPGRRSATGAIRSITAIPHISTPTSGGTVVNATFGDEFAVTRIEGQGNGGRDVRLSQQSVSEIMDGEPWRVEELRYVRGAAPVKIKVVDPLNVRPGNFELRFYNEYDEVIDGVPNYTSGIDSAQWVLINTSNGEMIYSDRTIAYQYEQLIPEYGISIEMAQYEYPENVDGEIRAELLSWEIEFADNVPWLSGIEDTDDFTLQNWIMSGRANEDFDTDIYGGQPCFRLLDGGGNQIANGPIDPGVFKDLEKVDEAKEYDGIGNGIIAPFRLVRPYDCGPSPLVRSAKEGEGPLAVEERRQSLSELFSVDLVFTPNKDLWTRVPVLEMQSNPALAEGGALKLRTREAPSVDKNGVPVESGITEPSDNPDDPNFINATGMGWFPGYAINVETGERLNMAFGEDSFLANDNGRDMLWNPTSRIYGTPGGEEIFGGQHYIYVFRNGVGVTENPTINVLNGPVPMYDYGKFLRERLNVASPPPVYSSLWKNCGWIMAPLAFGLNSVEEGIIPSEAVVRVRVAKPYEKYAPLTELGLIDYSEVGSVLDPINPDLFEQSINEWYPMYEFSISGESTVNNDGQVAEDALSLINIVPNPYHAFNSYERTRIDNRVKFVNLPQECTIKIYNLSGTLIRTLGKDSPQTFLDWDIKNEARIPVASGVYIMHIDVPDVGERVLKWFCVMRPTDLQNF